MVDVEVDVEGLEQLEQALEDGLKDGARESADWMVDEGKNRAQDLLRAGDSRGHSRIWRRETYHGFVDYLQRTGDGYFARLQNTSSHAYIVENGRKPGSTPPQVQDLMEWVVDKLNPAADFDPDAVQYWEPELQQLAASYGGGYVRTAFHVQDKIRREGIEGIRFMDKSHSHLKQVGPAVTKGKTEKHLRKALRQRGL